MSHITLIFLNLVMNISFLKICAVAFLVTVFSILETRHTSFSSMSDSNDSAALLASRRRRRHIPHV